MSYMSQSDHRGPSSLVYISLTGNCHCGQHAAVGGRFSGGQKVTQTGRKEDIFDASPKPQYYFALFLFILHSSKLRNSCEKSTRPGSVAFDFEVGSSFSILCALQTAVQPRKRRRRNKLLLQGAKLTLDLQKGILSMLMLIVLIAHSSFIGPFLC